MAYAPNRPERLIMADSGYYDAEYCYNVGCHLVCGEDLTRLIHEDVYNRGDFCWVDFYCREHVESLPASQVAEVLYLGRKFRPVSSPFIEGIQNRYAYLAHDDGYYCALYCKNVADFLEILASKIMAEVSKSRRRKFLPISEEVKSQLLSLSEKGLLIEFSDMIKERNWLQIPVYSVGQFPNMSEMYHQFTGAVAGSPVPFGGYLGHRKGKGWELQLPLREYHYIPNYRCQDRQELEE